MYTNTHGCTGAIIYAACPNKFIGAGLAFLSHYLLDYIGETGYGGKKIEYLIEGTFLAIFILLAFLSQDPMSYFIGWGMGNGPDLIDKRLLLNRNAKQYLSCHRFEGWKIGKYRIGIFSFNDWKLGSPVKIQFSRNQTIAAGIFATFLLALFTYFKAGGLI